MIQTLRSAYLPLCAAELPWPVALSSVVFELVNASSHHGVLDAASHMYSYAHRDPKIFSGAWSKAHPVAATGATF